MTELHYTCAHCGGTFVSHHDASAQRESLALWGRRGDAPGMTIVCDDCFQAFMSWWRDEPSDDKDDADESR
jgi:hypothetical protein